MTEQNISSIICLQNELPIIKLFEYYVVKISLGFNFADDENFQFRVDLISRSEEFSIERYKDKVKELYVEPKDEEILGSFLLEDSLLPPNNRQKSRTVSTSKKPSKKASNPVPEPSNSRV